MRWLRVEQGEEAEECTLRDVHQRKCTEEGKQPRVAGLFFFPPPPVRLFPLKRHSCQIISRSMVQLNFDSHTKQPSAARARMHVV